MRAIPSIVFSIIAYFMTGLQRTVSQFFIFLLTIFMASVFGSAMCFFVSAWIPLFGEFALLSKNLTTYTVSRTMSLLKRSLEMKFQFFYE
jgi:hypothetical protein